MLFHKDELSAEAKRSIPIISKRLRPAPVDSSQMNQCKCGSVFSLLRRKHHCRCCGEVFCYECTKDQMIVPRILLGYLQAEGWWWEGKPARVCEECKKKIQKYEGSRIQIQEFQRSPPRLDQIQKETDFDALSYYLSAMRQIQYLFPSDHLTPEQILFLKVNRDLLHNHSYWAIQLLKIGPLSSLDSFVRQDEVMTLCCRNCRPSLHLGNAVDMIIFSEIYSNSKKVALQMIRTATTSELAPYVPILVSFFNMAVLEILVAKAKEDILFANLVYWSLNVIGTLQATAFRENILLETQSRGPINLRHLIGALDSDNLQGVSTSIEKFEIVDPFDPLHKILRIDKIMVGTTSSKPIFITYSTQVREKKRMMYKREDVRKDGYITNLLRCLLDPLKVIQNPFPLISYEVIPISQHSGLIEIVESCQPLSSAVSLGSMSNFLQNNNSGKAAGEIQTIYQISLAFWTIITYLFGIGDRHFDNIMISNQGILFHVDYEFIFGHDPKLYSPQIRLNSYMIEGIGGDGKYEEFKQLCYRIFMILRQNMDLIYTLLLNLISVETRITEPFIKGHLSQVFFVGETDEEAKSHLEFIIDSSRDSVSGELNDYIHTVTRRTYSWFNQLR